MTGWLAGEVALITGGGSGLGRAVAERFVAEGARVAILGNDASQLTATVEAQPDPSRMLAIEGDVRDTDSLHAAVAQVLERFGQLDVLVPNAGVWDFQRTLTRLTGRQLAMAALPNAFVALDLRGRGRGEVQRLLELLVVGSGLHARRIRSGTGGSDRS